MIIIDILTTSSCMIYRSLANEKHLIRELCIRNYTYISMRDFESEIIVKYDFSELTRKMRT